VVEAMAGSTSSPTVFAEHLRYSHLSGSNLWWADDVHYRVVPTIRLDDVFTPGSVDILKIDVEGAELDVLMGAVNLLAGVRSALIEVHQPEVENVSALERFVETIEFKRRVISESNHQAWWLLHRN
jgi:hypothetical protein